MGLDMYLSVRKNISRVKSWDYSNGPITSPEFEKAAEATGMSKWEEPESIYGLEVQAVAAYWRKQNAIHNWFVKNVQKGQDDCGEYYVGRDKLTELRDLCHKILNDRTKVNELPTASGFFFGSVEYDEYYFNDLTDTVRIIDNALALPKSWGFYYSSSW